MIHQYYIPGFRLIGDSLSFVIFEAESKETALLGRDLEIIDKIGRLDYIDINEYHRLRIVITKKDSNSDTYRGFEK